MDLLIKTIKHTNFTSTAEKIYWNTNGLEWNTTKGDPVCYQNLIIDTKSPESQPKTGDNQQAENVACYFSQFSTVFIPEAAIGIFSNAFISIMIT